jgi:hypothetical protein
MPRKDIFDLVYKKVKSFPDVAALRQAIWKEKIYYLDVKKEGDPFMTPAAQFVSADDMPHMCLMFMVGANGGNIAYALGLKGVAPESMDRYFQEGGGKPFMGLLGYLKANHQTQIEPFLKRYEVSIDKLAYVYAIVNNDAAVEEYRTAGANVDEIAEGYAIAGNHEKVNHYRTTYNASVDAIARGYAFIGNHEKVQEYRNKHKANINEIAHGYVSAANDAKVNECMKHNADLNLISQYYQGTRNLLKAKEYNINIILDNYLEFRGAHKVKGETKPYYFKFFTRFQKSFKEKTNAVNALKEALLGNEVNLTEHLSTLQDGKLGKELRKFVKTGKGSSLVGIEVNTVKGFIQALSLKNKNSKHPSKP